MSLTTLMIPILSVVMASIGIVFFFLARKSSQPGMVWAALGMSILALMFDAVYLIVVSAGRA